MWGMAGFFDWWLGTPRWLRAAIALSVLGYSGYLLSIGVLWPWGWCLGGFLLLVSFPRRWNPPKPRDTSIQQDIKVIDAEIERREREREDRREHEQSV